MTQTHHGLRSDAARNVERISVAAMDVFAERGLEVSMAEVAERAGVGVGTVYRRFGSKDALIADLFAEKFEFVVAAAEQAASRSDPGRAFVNHCYEVCQILAENKGLRELLLLGVDGIHPGGSSLMTRLEGPMTTLIERAKLAGWIRDSFAHSDFLLILIAVHSTRDFGGHAHPLLWRRTLQLLLGGACTANADLTLLSVPPALTVAEASEATARGKWDSPRRLREPVSPS